MRQVVEDVDDPDGTGENPTLEQIAESDMDFNSRPGAPEASPEMQAFIDQLADCLGDG